MAIDDRIPCREEGCSFRSHSLLDHLATEHKMTPTEYRQKHGVEANTVSAAALHALTMREKDNAARRTSAPLPEDLTVSMMRFQDLKIQAMVPQKACLPMPDCYMFPTKGPAKQAVERLLIALLEGRNAFIWGMPGTGKDAAVHAYSAMTRRPVMMLSFLPGKDISPWFYKQSMSREGTSWTYGSLWKALTEGVKGLDGVAYPVTVLLSDVDRADSAQTEWFRLLADSISGRILGPDGEMHDIVPGTNFICTSNTCGTGDARGRMTSSNPMDASLLTRLGRKIEAKYMHWDDEGKVLQKKFPLLAVKTPEVFSQLGKATAALRLAIEKEELYAEFDMRGLCDVLAECEDILKYSNGKVPDNLLSRGFRAWLDGIDADSRLTASRLIDPNLKGGALGSDVDF